MTEIICTLHHTLLPLSHRGWDWAGYVDCGTPGRGGKCIHIFSRQVWRYDTAWNAYIWLKRWFWSGS